MSDAGKDDMTLRQRHEVGREVAESIFGAAPEIDRTTWPVEADLKAMWSDMCFADSWSRPGLERRTKSMLTIAMLLARGASIDLIRAHLAGALNLGITRDEIVELFIHVTSYCGAPATAGVWPKVRDLVVPDPSPAKD